MLPLASALQAAQEGKLPVGLPGSIPNPEQVARWLRPPDLPTGARAQRRDIWGSSFFMAVAIVVVFLTGLMLFAILGPWSLIITIAAMVGVYFRAKRFPAPMGRTTNAHENTISMRAWDRRMEVWERLGVCPKCGTLADPLTGRTAEWHSIPSLFVSERPKPGV
jgi:hypothetical protein